MYSKSFKLKCPRRSKRICHKATANIGCRAYNNLVTICCNASALEQDFNAGPVNPRSRESMANKEVWKRVLRVNLDTGIGTITKIPANQYRLFVVVVMRRCIKTSHHTGKGWRNFKKLHPALIPRCFYND